MDDRRANRHLVNRYSRQMLIPQFGLEGQKLLYQSSVIIIGGKVESINDDFFVNIS
jgi:molybdopterin/thiamine biosynthesis adenylyltransferase